MIYCSLITQLRISVLIKGTIKPYSPCRKEHVAFQIVISSHTSVLNASQAFTILSNSPLEESEGLI